MMKELNQIEDIFSDNQLTNLIKDSLKETGETQNSIKINGLNSFSKKNHIFSISQLPVVFLRDIYQKKLSINNGEEEQSIFYNKIKRKKHGRILGEKRKFLKKFFLLEEKMFLMLLKVIYF